MNLVVNHEGAKIGFFSPKVGKTESRKDFVGFFK
jgi:hypothetical protein